jgi:hypothetical protein
VTKFDPSLSGAASLVFTTLIPAIAMEDYTSAEPFYDGLYQQTYARSSQTYNASPNNFPTQASSGIAYFTGGTDNPDYPTTSSAYQTTCNANPYDTEGFCVPAMYASQLSSDGTTLDYSTLINAHAPISTTEDGVPVKFIYPAFGQSLAADNAGAMYISGYTWSGFPVTNGNACSVEEYTQYNPVPYCTSAVAVKLDTTKTGSSSLVYSEEFYSDTPALVATDGVGNLYWASDNCINPSAAAPLGLTTLTFNGYQSNYSAYSALAADGCNTLFKLNSTGGEVYGTLFYDPTGVDASLGMDVYGLAADSTGRVYLAGSIAPWGVTHTGLPIVNGFHSTDPNTEAGWVAVFDTTQTGAGSLVYSTVMEGISYDGFSALATNGCGSVAVTGESYSTTFPLVNPLAGIGEPGGSAGYDTSYIAAILNTHMTGTGSLTFSSTMPGSQTVQYMTLDQFGNLAATGFTGYGVNGNGVPYNYSALFPVTSNAYQTEVTRGFAAATGENPIFEVIGQAVLPGCINIAPVTLSFGDQAVNTTSTPPLQVTLTNTSPAALNIISVTPTTEFGESDNCVISSPLAVGASCNINVTFSPTAAGPQTGTLTITDSDVGSPQVIDLTGTGTAPVASLSANLNFGDQLLNTTSTPALMVTLTNTGTGNLVVSSSPPVTLGGLNPGDYGISSDGCSGATLPPAPAAGSSCTVYVTFTPATTGSLPATLTFTDNSGGMSGSTQSANLGGTGAVPVAALPPSLSFGNQFLNTTSTPAQQVTLSNTGLVPLTISNIGTTGNFNVTTGGGACSTGTPVAAGGSCYIYVTFTPASTGSNTGSLTVTDNSNAVPNSQQMTSLSGTGTVPVAGLPLSLSFGNEPLHASSTPQQVTLNNTGSAPLTISNIGASGNFSVTTGAGACSTGTPVAAGGFCYIYLIFTPQSTGSNTGTLTVTDNSGGTPGTQQMTSLSGTGTVPVAGLSPSLTFGNQTLNTTSGSLSVTLNNTGNAPLNISSIGASGSFAVSTGASACSTFTPVAVSGSCYIYLTFTPTGVGTNSGTLYVYDNSNGVNGSLQTANLSGTGIGPVAAVSTPSLPFGNQDLGTTSGAEKVTLSNTGNATLSISSIGVSGNFALTTGTGACGTSLAAGASCSIYMTFSPTSTGSLGGMLTITDNSNGVGGSQQTVSLSGTGIGRPSVAILSASPVLFGTTLTLTVTLENTGTGNGQNLDVTQVVLKTLSGTGTATLNTGLPLSLGSLAETATTPAVLSINVPAGVTKLSVTLNGTIQDVVGNTLSYSDATVVFP